MTNKNNTNITHLLVVLLITSFGCAVFGHFLLQTSTSTRAVINVYGIITLLANAVAIFFICFYKWKKILLFNRLLQDENITLKNIISNIRLLHNDLSTCPSCNSIQNKEGNWYQLDTYINNHRDKGHNYQLCPHCIEAYYSKFALNE